MPFQKGNKLAVGVDHSRRKLVTQQLIAALNERSGDVKKIRKVVDSLIEQAVAGEVPAIK